MYLCLLKVIGKCSSTSLFGCPYCKRAINEWGDDVLGSVDAQTMSEAVAFGKEALDTLGRNPDHGSKAFTDFQQGHYGQYVSMRVKSGESYDKNIFTITSISENIHSVQRIFSLKVMKHNFCSKFNLRRKGLNLMVAKSSKNFEHFKQYH